MYLLYVLAPASFPLQQASSDVITLFPHIKLEHVLHRYIEFKTITFISNSKLFDMVIMPKFTYMYL